MRTDKISHLKQRLRQGADSFDFNALINGVSTIEEENKVPPKKDPPAVAEPPRKPQEPVAPPAEKEEDKLRPVTVQTFSYGENHVPQRDILLEEATLKESAVPIRRNAVESPHKDEDGIQIQDDRMKSALNSLVEKLRLEITSFQTSLEDSDSEQAGFSLVKINHILDLLNSLDPEGSIARSLKIEFCPPQDRTWPKSVWSVVELAESPLSGLFPPQSDDLFIREILNAAWDSAPN